MKFLVQTPLEEIQAKEAELAAEKDGQAARIEKEMLIETVMRCPPISLIKMNG